MSSPPKFHSIQEFTFYEMWALHCDGMNAVDRIRELEEQELETSEKRIIEFLETCDSEGEALNQLRRALIAGAVICFAIRRGGSEKDEFKVRPKYWKTRIFRYPTPEAIVPNSPTSTPWELQAFVFRDEQENETVLGRPKGSKYTQWLASMHKRVEEGEPRTSVATDMDVMLFKLDPKKYSSPEAAREGLLKAYRTRYGPAKS